MKQFVFSLLILLVWGLTGPSGYCQKIKIKKSAVKDAVKEGEKETAQAVGSFKVGDVAEGLETDGKWYKVDILRVEGAKYFIHWQGFAPKYDRLIEADKLRAIAGGSSSAVATTTSAVSSGGGFKAGEKVEVMYSGSWRPGSITKVKNGKYSVNIGIDAASYLEFTGDKIRTPVVVAVVEKKADESEFKVGDKVDVLGRSMWLEATVLAPVPNSRGEITMYKVKETVSGEEWNASVNPIRIRKYTGPVVWNFSGKDFQVGQYVKVRYSGNDTIISQILEVKDNQFLIEYGGYKETWFAFDDEKVRNDVKTAAIEAARNASQQFWTDCGPYQKPILTFSWLDDPQENWAERDAWSGRGSSWNEEERITQIHDDYLKLIELEKIITEKGYGSLASEGGARSGKAATGNTGFIVNTSAKREEYAIKLVRFVVMGEGNIMKAEIEEMATLSGQMLPFYDGDRGHITTKDFYNNGCKEAIEGLRGRSKRFLAAIGKTEDPEITTLFTTLQNSAVDIKKKFMTNLQQTALPVFSYKDATLENAARTILQSLVPGAVVLRTGMIDADWKISKNSIGVPECRLKYAELAFKDPVTGLCAYASMQLAQDYAGGGTYATKIYHSGLYGHVFRYYLAKCQ